MTRKPVVFLAGVLPLALVSLVLGAAAPAEPISGKSPAGTGHRPGRCAKPGARGKKKAPKRNRACRRHPRSHIVEWPQTTASNQQSPAVTPPSFGATEVAPSPGAPAPGLEAEGPGVPPSGSPEEVTPPLEEVTPPLEEEADPPAEEPETTPSAEEPKEQGAPVEPPFRLFSDTSIWNYPVPAEASLDPESGVLVAALHSEVDSELGEKRGPGISTTTYSVPVYTVPADQPTVAVQLQSKYAVPALRSALAAVPLPPEAQAAPGSDGHLVVLQPSTDKLWEFWRLSRSEGSWQAAWGGAIEHVSSNSGSYGPASWPGADGTWGAAASGFSVAAGLIRLGDLKAGRIDHALAISLPQIRAGSYALPATRTDGRSTSPLALPEGAHLRIDPSLDLSRLSMPPLTRMLAEAAQRYGIVVRDISGSVTFYGEDPHGGGPDPYEGLHGYFEGRYPSELLAAFPWQHLQVLDLRLRGDP